MSSSDFEMKFRYENTIRIAIRRVTLCFNGRDVMNLLTAKSFLIALGSIADYVRNCLPKRDDISQTIFDTLIIEYSYYLTKVLRKCNSREM